MGFTGWLVVGLLTPATLFSLPAAGTLVLIAGVFLLTGGRWRAPVVGTVLALAWSLHQYHGALDARLPAAHFGDERVLTGRVVELPRRHADSLQFVLLTTQLPGLPGRPARVDVRWFRNATPVMAGETWRLRVRLAPPRARLNFSGVDMERHYLADRVSALATVIGPAERVQPARGLAGWRGRTVARLQRLLAERPGSGLVLALAVAARSELPAARQHVMQRTGTAHLLAVSGLHVGLVGGFTWWLLRWPLACLGAWWGARRPTRLATLAMLLAATAYAGLAGFDVSTRRALLMLSIPLALHLGQRCASPWTSWLLAAAAVLALDPLSALGAGFCLSFAAVGVLLFTFVPRCPSPGRWSTPFLAQWAMSWAMWPLGLAWFGTTAPLGLVANLVAIPWVSLLTLPLTLAGMCLATATPGLAEFLLTMAAHSGDVLLRLLEGLPEPTAMSARGPAPAAPVLALGVLGALLLTLPRGLPWRWLGLGLLVPLLLRDTEPPGEGALRLELLDVGQGLALLLQTREHALVVDSGPGMPGQWDRVDDTLLPALARLGIAAPDRILVSHADLDHAGGLQALRQHYPDVPVHANLGPVQRPEERCHDRLGWTWNEVDFQVLHPSPWLPYRGNDSSCVLAVSTPGASLLLPGDIGRLVEGRLAALTTRGHALVVAPHHGSRSSSSPALLDWSRPQAALAASGWGNRFGFPHPEVRARYSARDVPLWTTADCGALRVAVERGGDWQATSARRMRPAPWRYPPAADCP